METMPILRSLFRSSCSQCRQRGLRAPARRAHWPTNSRHLSESSSQKAGSKDHETVLTGLSSLANDSTFTRPASSPLDLSDISPFGKATLSYRPPPKPHHLHIYATKHNCHITLTAGNRDAILSVTSGTLNFRKANRGTYDAAFQLGAFVMAKIKNMGLLNDNYPGKGGPIRALEVVLRDFGPGRDAVTKILMGQEGKDVRGKVTRVMDCTRLKFGGTRSPKPRRLG